jgi:glycerol kinase
MGVGSITLAMLVLGIDQGTTGTRARLYDAAGARVLGEAYRTHAQHLPGPGLVEHDAAEILSCVRATLDEACAGRTPDAIGLANPGESVVAWDARTGEPIHRALSWQDTRTQSAIDALARDPAVAARVTELTGLRLDPYFSASKMHWLLERDPGARVGTLDTWILWKLSGGAAYVTDASTAARTLLYDIRAHRWDPWLCEVFGVPIERLPAVVDTTGLLARTVDGVPVTASLVDQPAAMVGQGCLRPGAIKASFGTGCFVYLHTGEAPRPSAHGLSATVAWRRAGKTAYALDGGVLAAGSVVTWLREGLALADSDAELDALAGSVPDGGGARCVPALTGLGAPWWSRQARAAWLDLSMATSRAHLVRAAYEGVACRVVEVVRAMERDAGLAVAALRVDGGLVRSAPLMQLQADLLGAPVEVSAEPEATVAGACFLAAGLSDDEVLGRVATGRVFVPRISVDEREARLARFAEAARLVQAFHA